MVPVRPALLADPGVVFTMVILPPLPPSYEVVIVTYGSALNRKRVPGTVPEGAIVEVEFGAPGPPSLKKPISS